MITELCGMSTAMIELDYSHITPFMYGKELAGSERAELTKLINKKTSRRRKWMIPSTNAYHPSLWLDIIRQQLS